MTILVPGQCAMKAKSLKITGLDLPVALHFFSKAVLCSSPALAPHSVHSPQSLPFFLKKYKTIFLLHKPPFILCFPPGCRERREGRLHGPSHMALHQESLSSPVCVSFFYLLLSLCIQRSRPLSQLVLADCYVCPVGQSPALLRDWGCYE